jgi:Zn-dependent peptidase ImmA (M78 family)/transcriptional regulator with XRE-family HTH domain
MARATEVPVTPSVIRWAIEQSGFDLADVASGAAVAPAEIRAWMSGSSRPSLTQARELARKLKRSLATFLLPAPPQLQVPPLEFRNPPGTRGRQLNPGERLAVREAARLQRTVAWALTEMATAPPSLPRFAMSDDPEMAAARMRGFLQAAASRQQQWRSSSEALHEWRSALEGLGLLVFLIPLGPDSCRGFSLWDERAPLVAANTWWNAEARIFSLFHEFGHLLTRTSSACTEVSWSRPSHVDPAERWCEEFAAALLLPWPAVSASLASLGLSADAAGKVELAIVQKLARKFKVSMRAAAVRLIKKGLADGGLYMSIPPVTEQKKRGGGGVARPRYQIRRDEYGSRVTGVFLDAVKTDVLTRSDALDYLDIADSELDALSGRALSKP